MDALADVACQDWSAVFDSGRMRVSGLCIVPTTGYGIELRRHEPQQAEDELLLELVVEKPAGIVLQVVTAVPVAYEEVTDRGYDRVSILPHGPSRLPVVGATE
jgi:hypothetical protein